ncbi:putative adipocyte plasma membrane-associated protein [Trichinella spiralis]|uniref:putative adipocyte plasma membrane-associated protein n=1 Tax=Trichinella spiralis TaxID=6334 RepID=UPI0001EFC390|nr:putative adipocyte plasma membrane-associated protein [Trichinella spiralis]
MKSVCSASHGSILYALLISTPTTVMTCRTAQERMRKAMMQNSNLNSILKLDNLSANKIRSMDRELDSEKYLLYKTINWPKSNDTSIKLVATSILNYLYPSQNALEMSQLRINNIMPYCKQIRQHSNEKYLQNKNRKRFSDEIMNSL